MFEFKKPIIEKNKKLERFLKDFATRFENEFTHYNKDIYTLRHFNGNYRSYFDYDIDPNFDMKGRVFKSTDYSDNVDELFIKELKESYLKDEIEKGEHMDSIWSAKIYCPYTNILVRTVYFSLYEYTLSFSRKSMSVKIPYITDYKDKNVEQVIVEKQKIEKIGDYKLPPTSSNKLDDYYSEPVLKLFKNEWGINSNEIKLEDNHIKKDNLNYVEIFYKSTNGYVRKDALFNFKNGRYVNKPSETVIIPSPDIDNFDVKLNAILNGDTYVEFDMSDMKSPTEIIQDILNEHISETEKLNKIKELLE